MGTDAGKPSEEIACAEAMEALTAWTAEQWQAVAARSDERLAAYSVDRGVESGLRREQRCAHVGECIRGGEQTCRVVRAEAVHVQAPR